MAYLYKYSPFAEKDQNVTTHRHNTLSLRQKKCFQALCPENGKKQPRQRADKTALLTVYM
jgi:hypothetical protein